MNPALVTGPGGNLPGDPQGFRSNAFEVVGKVLHAAYTTAVVAGVGTAFVLGTYEIGSQILQDFKQATSDIAPAILPYLTTENAAVAATALAGAGFVTGLSEKVEEAYLNVVGQVATVPVIGAFIFGAYTQGGHMWNSLTPPQMPPGDPPSIAFASGAAGLFGGMVAAVPVLAAISTAIGVPHTIGSKLAKIIAPSRDPQ